MWKHPFLLLAFLGVFGAPPGFPGGGAQHPDGAFILSFKGPGDIHTPLGEDREVTVALVNWKPGAEEPLDIKVTMPIPSGTTPFAAAASLGVMLETEGVDPANLKVTESSVLINKGVEAAGYHQPDPSGFRASGAAFHGGRKRSRSEVRRSNQEEDRTWTTGAGELTYSITGEDLNGDPAWDGLTIAIPSGLNDSQLDQHLVRSFLAKGWSVLLTGPGEILVESNPTVVVTQTVKVFTTGAPGFVPLGGQVP